MGVPRGRHRDRLHRAGRRPAQAGHDRARGAGPHGAVLGGDGAGRPGGAAARHGVLGRRGGRHLPLGHVHLRRPAALRAARGRAPAGGGHRRQRGGHPQGVAPGDVQRLPVDARPHGRRRGARRLRHHAQRRGALGAVRRGPAGDRPGRGRLLRHPRHARVRRRRAARAQVHRARAAGHGGTAEPGVRRAARPRAPGRRRDGALTGARAAVRGPAGRRLLHRHAVDAPRPPGAARRADRPAEPQDAHRQHRGGARRGPPGRAGRPLPAGPRPVQGGQRHDGPPGRRPAAADGRAPAHPFRTARRRRGAAGRRRVRRAAALDQGRARRARGCRQAARRAHRAGTARRHDVRPGRLRRHRPLPGPRARLRDAAPARRRGHVPGEGRPYRRGALSGRTRTATRPNGSISSGTCAGGWTTTSSSCTTSRR